MNFEIKDSISNSIYKNGQIEDIYAVLGKNGSGKSSLLDMIGYHNDNASFYFLVFENAGEIKVLFSRAWEKNEYLKNNPCKIKYKSDDYLFNCSNYSDILLGVIKNIYGNLKFKYNNVQYIRENFLGISDILFLDFVYREKEFLNFHDSKQIEFVLHEVGYLDDIHTLFSNLNQDFISILANIDIADSLFGVYRYIFVIFLAMTMRYEVYVDKKIYKKVVDKVNLIISNLKKDLIGLKNLVIFKQYILDVIEEMEILISSEFNSTMFSLHSYYQSLFNYLENLNFLYLYDDKICFRLSDINDLNLEKFKEFIQFIATRIPFNPFSLSVNLEVSSSTGEQAYIELIACIKSVVDKFNEEDGEKLCLLCLDEVEQNLHPEWCRVLLKKIYDLISQRATKHKYIIYLSTHSPYIVSDFTSDHIINLDNTEGMDFNTFGANIHDILNKGMFLEKSMGEFAYQCITDVISDLEGNSDESHYDDETIEYIINCIGEPFIKNHLKLLYEKKKKRKMLQKYEHMTKEELIELLERKEHDQNRN